MVMDTSGIPQKKGMNHSDMLNGNQSLVVKHLLRTGGCSRAELARVSGLTQASITKIVASLTQMNIVEETGLSKGERGRRVIALRLCSEHFMLIGVKLARTSFSVGLFNLAGEQHEAETHRIHIGQAPEDVMNRIEDIIRSYQKRIPNVIAIGVSVPGPYLRKEGVIAKMTEYPGWESLSIRGHLEKHIDIPVYVEHDANAGALAEWWFGDNHCDTLVHLLVSEGVGAGIIENGKLLLGCNGVAGEIGHMSIAFDGRKCQCSSESRGCLEQYCSSLSFERDVREALPHHPESSLSSLEAITANDVFHAADMGDAFAIEMVKSVATYLGIGIANVINIYNPDCIVISDIMANGGTLLLNTVIETVRTRVFHTLLSHLTIKLCDLRYDPVLYGAVAVALDQFLKHPSFFSTSGVSDGEEKH